MSKSSSTPWKKVRNIFNQIHLYAGLTCGLIVIAVCLSGTIYVYNSEIRNFFDSELFFVEAEGNRLSLNELEEKLESEYKADVTQVFWTADADRSVQFTLKNEIEKGRGTTYYVNPYNAEVLGDNSSRTATQEFMSYMFSLHRWLLLDRVEEPILESMGNRDLGRFINGVATLLFLLGVITGLVIWVPNKIKNWKQGLKIKWSGNWKRVNHDLHNTLAFYSLIILFIMAATGPFWSFSWYREGYQKTFDTYQTVEEKEAEKNKLKPSYNLENRLSLNELLSEGNRHLPYNGNTRIYLPQSENEAIQIRKYKTGFFSGSGSDQVFLSPEDLTLVEASLFSDLPLRQQVGRSVKALHTGEIFGQFSKFLWFLACLVATSLPISGTLIWWNKRKKKSPRRQKKDKKVLEMA